MIMLFLLIAPDVHAFNPPKSAIVIQSDTKSVLYNDHADAHRHPASLTKKMTLYLLFEALEEGRITLNTRYTVSQFANNQMPSRLGILAGQQVTVDTIIKSLVTKSANDMAVVAAEGMAGSVSAFVAKMNAKAKQLGMHKTVFKNPSGVPDKHQWTTARDMATLGQALYHHFPQFWQYFQLKHFSHQGKMHKNHNKLLHSYPGSDGIKTGFINASGFNVSTSAVRYKNDGKPVRLFVVVMGGNTGANRDRRVAELFNTYFAKLGAHHIKPASKQSTNQQQVGADSKEKIIHFEDIIEDTENESVHARAAKTNPTGTIDLETFASLSHAKSDDEATDRIEAFLEGRPYIPKTKASGNTISGKTISGKTLSRKTIASPSAQMRKSKKYKKRLCAQTRKGSSKSHMLTQTKHRKSKRAPNSVKNTTTRKDKYAA